MNSPLTPGGLTVRTHDPDRFLISLFAPHDRRAALWALFAFNYEIAKTRSIVTETMLGRMRLQWWLESVDRIYKSHQAADHDVLQALAPVIRAYDLPFAAFETLIAARNQDMEDAPPPEEAALLQYCNDSSVPLLELMSRIAGAREDAAVLKTIGVNYALTGLVRAVPYHAARGLCFIPQTILSAYDLTAHNLWSPDKRENLRQAVQSMASLARPAAAPANRCLKAAQALNAVYTMQLAGLRYDLHNPRISAPPAFKELRVALKTVF